MPEPLTPTASSSSTEGTNQAPKASCCSVEEQSSCCVPEAKSTCCAPQESQSPSCGCR
jgi:hypothetical protein